MNYIFLTTDPILNFMQKTNLSLWKYDYYLEQIRRTFHLKKNQKNFRVKKHENYVITNLLHDERLRDLKPVTQYYVPLSDANYALIDIYYPQINLAIEVDEPHHLENKAADLARQKAIEEKLQCKFIRFNVDEGNVISGLATAKEEMLELMKILKAKNEFAAWNPVETLDIEAAKEKYTNTLFIKIKGLFKPEEMYSRYRGRWPLAEKKLQHINRVIVVHDRIISKVFKNPTFKRFKEDNKVYFEAEEDTTSKILGNHITNWEYQITWTYSKDLERLSKSNL